jgi:hypothetical protein
MSWTDIKLHRRQTILGIDVKESLHWNHIQQFTILYRSVDQTAIGNRRISMAEKERCPMGTVNNVLEVEQARPMSFAYRAHEGVRVWQLYFMARRGWFSQLEKVTPHPDAFTVMLYDMATTIVEEMREEQRKSEEHWREVRAARLIRKQYETAARADGIKPSTFRSRIANGWDREKAINTPTRRYADRSCGVA